ncbi:MobF family relaxase (plasmid) [Kitasatospora griseola]|uniref:MobF family relaxase n=1 Tax=Kitasatospora griseola TaxID=2064 RepID=UPI0038559399
MAVTTIRSDAQVEYRLIEGDGCDREHQVVTDAAVDYRLDGNSRPLEWVGQGLAEVGLVAGERVDPHAARALMAGLHPTTREQLTTPVWRVADAGKLSAAPLLEALQERADLTAATSRQALMPTRELRERLARLERADLRDRGEHRAPVVDLARLATAAGIDLESVYRPAALASAWRHAGDRERVDAAGDDVGFTLPKSLSTAWGLAPPEVRDIIEEEFLATVRESVAALESWASYGVTGHQGDGQIAERIDSSGFLGWIMLHKSARPVAGSVGDPHLHAHVVLARMVRCEDGKWRSPASGGRDIRRHSHAANELQKALLRTRLTERLGVQWEYNEANREWEIGAVPAELRGTFSRRNRQVLEAGGAEMTTAQRRVLAAKQRQAKTDLPEVDVLAAWRTNALQVLADRRGAGGEQRLADVLTAAFPGPAGPGEGLDLPHLAALAERVFDPETGLTSKHKAFSRAQALAEVARALPPGLVGPLELETLTDQVLAEAGHAIALADLHASHHSNAARYTTLDVLAAEQVIATQARERIGDLAAALHPLEAEQRVAAYEQQHRLVLGAEQRAAVLRLLAAGLGVDTVQGLAGAGKTTMLAAARAAWEEAGLSVRGAAMMAVAAQNLQAESGIASDTVASWLLRIDSGEGLAGIDVLVLDEAAMADDRTLAKLLAHAALTRTKVVLVGDEQQLQPIGIGGGFAEIHRIVSGLGLTENRRQADPVERDALKLWRTGARSTALAQLADAGHVHATATGEQTTEQMLTAWDTERHRWADPHENLRSLLLLAGRNNEVDRLNAGARAIRRAAGELGPDTTFPLADGGLLDLAVGDLVRTKVNDRRARRTEGREPDILNGYRGLVLAVDERGALVEWQRAAGPGHRITERAHLSAQQIADGALVHAYAMTVTAAQGLTATRALIDGTGADAFVLYPAITRAKERSDLWLPLERVEDEATRARLGDPASDGQRLLRAVSAYGRTLDSDHAEGLISGQVTRRGPVGPNTPDGDNPGGGAGLGRSPRTPRGPEPDGPGGGTALAAPALLTVDSELRPDDLEPADRTEQRTQGRPHPAAALLAPWRARTTQTPTGPGPRPDIDALVEELRDHRAADLPRPEDIAHERGRQAHARRTTATTATHRATARAAADQAGPGDHEPHRSGRAGQLARAAERRAEQLRTPDRAEQIRTARQQATAVALTERPAPHPGQDERARTGRLARAAERRAEQLRVSTAALAERIRAELAEAQRQAEQRAARLAADAKVPAWHERPYGRLTDQEIKPAHNKAIKAAEAAEKDAAARQREADALGRVLGTDQSPAAARVGRRTGLLTHSEAYRQVADQLSQNREQIRQQITNLWEEQRREHDLRRRILERADSWTVKATFRAPSLREAADLLAQRIADREGVLTDLQNTQLPKLESGIRAAKQEADRLRTEAGAQPDESVQQLRERITPGAHSRDARTHQAAVSEATQLRQAAETQRAKAAGLVEEARTRKGLSPERRAAENTRRAAYLVRLEQQRREQRAAQEQLRQQRDQYRYRGPEGPSRGGPSLGR